jgi:hypothetical protein
MHDAIADIRWRDTTLRGFTDYVEPSEIRSRITPIDELVAKGGGKNGPSLQ